MIDKGAITRLRKATGFSQQQAADAAGIFVQQWNRVEAGDIENPRLDTMEKIARVLGCSIDDLVVKPKRKRGGK